MQLLDQYFEIQQQIYDHFDYVEDWVVIPIDDRRESYWVLTQQEVWYSPSREDLIAHNEDNIYSDEIYTQRFLPKWVYEAPDYTMICVDTYTDGNKFLAIYDNQKRLRDKDFEEEDG